MLWAKPVIIVAALYAGEADEGERLQPRREITTPLLDLSGQVPYRTAQQSFDPFFPKGAHLY